MRGRLAPVGHFERPIARKLASARETEASPTTASDTRRTMFFRQILHRDLGCASYVIADGGEAAVVDPKWEIADYLRLAEQEGCQITDILETHNHADHLSGRGH